MNKKIILSFIVVVLLTGCSITEKTKPKKEVIQERQEQDYTDPYVDEIEIDEFEDE